MATSAGWDGTLNAIFDDTDCKLPDSEIGETGLLKYYIIIFIKLYPCTIITLNDPNISPGDCGKFAAGIAYMVMYLVLR